MAHRNIWRGFLPLLGLTLISVCASPQVPTGSGVYYVAPAAQASPGPFKPAATVSRKNYLFVAASSLNLYSLPLASSSLVKVLHGNDKVEKIAESSSGWFKVRHLLSGAEGWSLGRYFKETPIPPQSLIVPKPKKGKKKPVMKRPKEEAPSEPEPLRPEAM